MKLRLAIIFLIVSSVNVGAQDGGTLLPPASFDNIADPAARSAALFLEASKVITHPRCLNCHPNGRVPTQGDNLRPHVPYINAGEAGMGKAGLSCTGCHQSRNVPVATQGSAFRSIPGHAPWMLAPASMAWQQKSVTEICRQIKDTSRNGGMSLAKIEEHMHKDALVGWAWHPGEGRVPAPGTQDQFGQLIQAWIKLGAACP
ncbi:Isoquinoline 1-oxidoreductase subunit [Duganella aceris]|uniref:Isoquinoline 1-oxidoreductase subunit n=1 Tax=Duganella aceris TaxID=2703883 RepID=A0ABX0FQX2_9BURK|nr:Isoquinoline 1-oxidoreductase subunit [Duganella aceris]NGZ87051.1 Isoquinoline 1-oxidoreductase subunit [Duganella aceris]